jgi:hypothetical protein
MRIPSVIGRSWPTVCSLVLASYLVLDARSAAAAVIYDFSLDANGDVGAVTIQVTVDDFLPTDGLNVFAVSGPEVTAFSSGTPVDLDSSFVGIDVIGAATLIGLRLSSLIGDVLTTVDYPADFFVFDRAPAQLGAVASSGGRVVSDLVLATPTPTATLVVTKTVPEPVTAALLGLGAFGLVAWRRRARASA